MKTKFITHTAAIAALYVALTLISAIFGLSSGAVQIRLSEALCILPVFTPCAIPGLFIGCIIANLLTGAVVLDVVFGSIATLIGALGTYLLRKSPRLAVIPPVVSNVLIVPYVIINAYGATDSYFFLMTTVGAGEIISCALIGCFIYKIILRTKIKF